VKLPFIGDSKKDTAKEMLVGDMAQYLMGYGFKSQDAFKASKEFWDRNMGKIEQVYSG
jgi:hypothetical protein